MHDGHGYEILSTVPSTINDHLLKNDRFHESSWSIDSQMILILLKQLKYRRLFIKQTGTHLP